MLGTRALIGRDEELARLTSHLDAAAHGTSAAVLVRGTPGIGKTTLLDAVAAEAAARDMTVLRARAVEAEQAMPFAGLHELLASQLGACAALAPHHASAISVSLGLEPGESQPPFALAVALLALIGAIADDAPGGLLLCVDDAQWLDEGSLEALRFAARRLGGEGCLLLLGARTTPDRGLTGLGFPQLDLEPLDDGAAELLTRSAAPESLAAEPLAQLIAAGAGNPLALVEQARMLSTGEATGAEPLPNPLVPSKVIDGVFRSMLDAAAPGVADALAVAAADERATRAELTSALTAMGLDPGVLAEAEAAGFAVADGARLEFRHPLLRSVAYHRAGGVRQRAAHAALAAVCVDESRRAHHLAAAVEGADETVAALVETQAASAVDRGALDAGSRGYARAAELSPAPAERARRAAEAAELFARIGRPDRALALIDGLGEMPDGDPGIDLRWIHGEVTMRSGQLDAGYRELLTLAAEVEDRQPAAASELLVTAALRDRIVGDYPAMRRNSERAAQLAGPQHPVHSGFADAMLAVTLANTGDARAADEAIDRAFAAFDAHGFDDFSSELRATASHVLIWLGHLDRAGRYLGAQVGDARRADALTELICPLSVQAQLELRRGRLGNSYRLASESLSLAIDTRQAGFFAFAAGNLAEAEAALGREDDCREHAAAALAIAEGVGGSALGLWSRSAIGMLELGLGRYEEAVVELDACRRVADRIGLVEPSVVLWRGNHVEALLRLGHREEAQASLLAFERGTPSTWWSWATASRLRGLLADEGIDDLEASVAAFDVAGATFEAARSRLVLGERLRRQRQRRAARKPLRQALLTFEQAGATPWAARARAELRATGESITPGGAINTDELTPHELRVALLVADGRTNPEVAAELYMARKTVEHHLSQIYRKLGLRGRTELAKALAGEPRG